MLGVSQNSPIRSSSRTLISRRVLKRTYGARGRFSWCHFQKPTAFWVRSGLHSGQEWIALGIIESR